VAVKNRQGHDYQKHIVYPHENMKSGDFFPFSQSPDQKEREICSWLLLLPDRNIVYHSKWKRNNTIKHLEVLKPPKAIKPLAA